MTGVVLGLAAITAVMVVGLRRWWQSRAAARRPGASLRRPIHVSRFDQIDRALRRRRCRCGNPWRLDGEGSRQRGVRRLRVVQVECPECGRREHVWFDVTRAFH